MTELFLILWILFFVFLWFIGMFFWTAVAFGNPIVAVRRRLFSTFLLEHILALTRLELPLQTSLSAFVSGISRGSRRDIEDLEQGLIKEGLLLGDALARVPRPYRDWFGWFVHLRPRIGPTPAKRLVTSSEAEVLRIGEMSGDLRRAIEVVLAERGRFADLKRSLYFAFLYPAQVLIIAGGIFSGILTYIMPKFRKMSYEMDVSLPAMTQNLTAFADFARNYWYWLVLFIIFLSSAFMRGRNLLRPLGRGSRTVSDFVQRLLYLVPFIHASMRRALLAEFCRELAMLLRVGTPAHRALQVISEGTMNPWFRDRVRRAAELCEQGVDLGAALDQARLDRRTGWFGGTSASNADLAEALHRLSEDYTSRIVWTTSVAARLVPPMIILCLGIFVGFAVIGLFLPLVKLMGSIGG